MIRLRDKRAPFATTDEAHEAAEQWCRRLCRRLGCSPYGWAIVEDRRGGWGANIVVIRRNRDKRGKARPGWRQFAARLGETGGYGPRVRDRD